MVTWFPPLSIREKSNDLGRYSIQRTGRKSIIMKKDQFFCDTSHISAYKEQEKILII